MIHSSVIKRFSFLLVPILFLFVSLATIYDYGMNWDSPVHFARGQAYLRYILTGKSDYNDNPKFCTNSENLNSRVDSQTGEVCDRRRKIRVSEYESNLLDFNSWVSKGTYGHPAFSDIMIAASNSVFFKALGWVEDIDSYHLYSLFVTFLLALTVSHWAKNTFGNFSAVIAALTVYTFPLLFAEQHLNVKDPPMAAFFTISLYFFWLGITRKKSFYLIISALAGGASFGTKFNFVFAPFILLPWFVVYTITQFKEKLLAHKKLLDLFPKRILLALTLYPMIVFLVFFLSWPALWPDPLNSVFQVFKYYKDIGGPTCSYSYFTLLWLAKCTQTITLQYFLYTIPPFSLFLFFVGSIVSIVRFKEKNYVAFLWLSLFYFTILRVTFSITNIYGGLRQIMEFVAPMAMIVGLGAVFLRNLIAKILVKLSLVKECNKDILLRAVSFMFILGYVPIATVIVKLHPNENVYFNFLIGGLKGAAEKDFSGYGNTYGNAYLQGVKWLNQNAEPDARLALVLGNAQNVSRGTLREDIDFSNGSRSGYNLEGEYQMLLITAQDQFNETFRYKYLSKFLDPIYDLEVDGVSLLKIWKNDKNHLKDGIKQDEISNLIKTKFKIEKENKNIIIKLEGKQSLRALGLTFPSQECRQQMIGVKVNISLSGDRYSQKADNIDGFTEREINGYGADFVYLFPGDEAQYIKITPPNNYPCELSKINLSLTGFSQLHKTEQELLGK